MKNTQENTVHTALSAVGHFFGELGCSLAKGLRKFFSNGKTIVGFAILVFFVLVAVFGPLLFPYNSDTDMANSYLMPSWEHPFGTDWLGRDVFRQVIAGTGSVLEIAFYSAVFTVVIGTVLGIVSGYLGGWVDKVIMAVTNIFLSIPSFPIYLLLAAIVTINTPVSLSVIISIWSWAGLCRAVRVQIMSLKERDFIQICTVMHMSKAHIIFRELLPNVFSYIAINFVMAMRNAIMASVGIMLVGLAAYDPTNWGAILLNAMDYGAMVVPEARLYLFAPIIFIMLFQLGAILFSDGLDEAINPRLRKN